MPHEIPQRQRCWHQEEENQRYQNSLYHYATRSKTRAPVGGRLMKAGRLDTTSTQARTEADHQCHGKTQQTTQHQQAEARNRTACINPSRAPHPTSPVGDRRIVRPQQAPYQPTRMHRNLHRSTPRNETCDLGTRCHVATALQARPRHPEHPNRAAQPKPQPSPHPQPTCHPSPAPLPCVCTDARAEQGMRGRTRQRACRSERADRRPGSSKRGKDPCRCSSSKKKRSSSQQQQRKKVT